MPTAHEHFIEAITILLSDWPPVPVDVLFLYGRARGDEEGLLELVASLQKQELAKHVIINGSAGERHKRSIPGEAWPGKDDWTKQLQILGVASIHYSVPGFNTLEESAGFLRAAKENNWKTAAIVAQPHQLLRAMLSLIKLMADQNFWIRIYAISPKTCNWWKEVLGSQGTMLLPRYQHIQQELLRIDEYVANESIAKPEELLAYYKQRETI